MEQKRPADIIQELLDYLWNGLGLEEKGWKRLKKGDFKKKMSTLFLPDLQYHFHGMDPNWVVNHAYNVASYILEHDNPIQDGETIDGVADGQMCREIQWKCQYEDALIQPPRGVLDINMGNYASGGR